MSEERAVAQKDRMSFEEACKELQVSEDELEQFVANGEIASIKEGDSFFFKTDVVAQFKKSRKTEPTIILADEDMEILGMEEIDLATPVKPVHKQARPAAPAAKVPEKVIPAPDLEMEDIVIEPRGVSKSSAKGAEPTPVAAETGAPDETVLNLDGLLEDDGSEGTTPIPGGEIASKMLEESSDITVEGNVSDETLLDTDLLEIGEEEDSFKLDSATVESIAEPTEANLLRGGGARAMQMKRMKSHAPWTISLVLTAIVLLVPLGISLNTFFVTKDTQVVVLPPDKVKVDSQYKWVLEYNLLGGVIEGISDLFH